MIPADLRPRQTAEMQRLAVECYARWNAKAWRASIFCWKAPPASSIINEINTIPGFTSISMYPKMWEYSGFPMPKLIDRLIELALDRHEAKKRLRYSK